MKNTKQIFKNLQKALEEGKNFTKLLIDVNFDDLDNKLDDKKRTDNLDIFITYLLKGIEIEKDNCKLYDTICTAYSFIENWEGIIALENNIPNVPKANYSWQKLAFAYFHEKKYEKIYHTVSKFYKFQKEFNKESSDYFHYEDTILLPKPIESIEIENYYSIENIRLDHLADKKEIYFLGENRVGKTILFQAITIALKDFYNKKAKTTTYLYKSQDILRFLYLNTFAYGVGRLRTHDFKADTTGYGTLFDDDKNNSLTNPVLWLKEIDRLEQRNIGNLKLNNVLKLLNEVLSIDINKENYSDITIELDIKTGEIAFKEQNTSVGFNQLADGYRSILIVLTDLLKRLSECQPTVTDMKDFRGVVLIDEIDMLLHPKWEYAIVKKLREKFPLIQWFLSTHSPVLILGASDDAVFYRLYKENGKTKISEPWESTDIAHLMANSLITSPLFNLPTARMKSLKDRTKMDTSSNYWVGKIYDKIRQQVDSEKNKGKEYLNKQEIDDFITWAINEIDEEVMNDKD